MIQGNNIRFGFFGSSQMSITVLDTMKASGLKPAVIITSPDKPQGRQLKLTPNIVKQWALQNNIKVFDFPKLDENAFNQLQEICRQQSIDIFIVASYGKIIPAKVLELPRRHSLNIHPSLLPKYRGPSPLQQAILDDTKETGVTIIEMDALMDHGPIVAQKVMTVNEWPIYEDFEKMMASQGARLMIEILPDWVARKIEAKEQDHLKATITKKFTKEDGLIDINDLRTKPHDCFRKIQALHEWPIAYFIHEHNNKKIRVKITSASWADGKLIIQKVIPEGSREMSFTDFCRGYEFKI